MKVFLIILGLNGQPDAALTFYNSVTTCQTAADNLAFARWTNRPVMAECRDTMTGLEWTRTHF